VAAADHGSDADPRGDAREAGGDGGDGAPAHAAHDARLADRHVHAGREHQHREADCGEERRRRLGRLDPAGARLPDGNARRQFTDDDRHHASARHRQQRSAEAGENEDGKDAEAHAPTL
jgi:hypothetical protein